MDFLDDIDILDGDWDGLMEDDESFREQLPPSNNVPIKHLPSTANINSDVTKKEHHLKANCLLNDLEEPKDDLYYLDILKKLVNQNSMYTIAEFAAKYPELCCGVENMNIVKKWYKDIVKKVASKGKKNKLIVDPCLLNHPLSTEQLRMFRARNNMVHAMSVLEAKGNKKRLLRIVCAMDPECNIKQFVTGGDPRPDTLRLILMYERESGITARTRKTPTQKAPKACKAKRNAVRKVTQASAVPPSTPRKTSPPPAAVMEATTHPTVKALAKTLAHDGR